MSSPVINEQRVNNIPVEDKEFSILSSPLSHLQQTTNPVTSQDKSDAVRALLGSSRLIELYEFGRHHPESGGNYWSLQVATLCREYKFLVERYLSTEKKTIPFDVKYALMQKCEGVPTTLLESDALARAAGSAKDIRSQDVNRLVAASTEDGPLEVLNLLFKSGDALTYAANIDKVLFSNGSGEIYFDGVWFKGEKSKLVQLAAELASCELGFPCDRGRFEVEFSCQVDGLCASDYLELMKTRAMERGIAVDDLLKMSARIAQAFRDKNAQAFIPRAVLSLMRK